LKKSNVKNSSGQTKSDGITFFVPCLNEERNIVKTLETIKAAVIEVGLDYQILIFDDCSRDNCCRNIEDYMKGNLDMAITLTKNRKTMGLGRNYIDGAFLGKYKYYMCIFGGHSEPKETIVAILNKLGHADMIVPYFDMSVNRSMFRRLLSLFYTFIVNTLSGNSIHYYNWSVAHLRENVMRWHSNSLGFGYQAEMVTQLISNGASYIELALPNCEEKCGKSNSFRLQNIFSVLHSLFQIFLRRLRMSLFGV